MTGRIYCAVYDFGLFPYALGDVLTWNVQTAIRCEELGRLHLSRPILRPQQVPAGAVVYLAFVREVSAAISRRLTDLPVSFAALPAPAA